MTDLDLAVGRAGVVFLRGEGGACDQGDHADSEKRQDEVDPDEVGRPFVLDQTDVRKSGKAYPGTMFVYTAAKLRSLDKAEARKVALFIRTATTEGQRSGAGNGQLPAGYLAIKKTGPTKKLFQTAQAVADAVEAQTPEPTEEPAPTETAAPTLPPSTADTGGVSEAPSGEVPTDVPSGEPAPTAAPAGPTTIAMPQTEAVSSAYGDRTVPVLLLIGLVGLLVTGAIRFLVRPPRGDWP